MDSLNLVFIKNTNECFSVTNLELLNKVVNETVDKLSLNKKENFQSIINNYFVDQIISRAVSSEFDRQFPDYFNTHNLYIRFELMFENRKILISMGKVKDEDKQKILSGVLYL